MVNKSFSRRLLCVIAAAVVGSLGIGSGAFAAGPVVVKAADFPRPAKPPLGVNLEQVCDYARSMMFVDMMKSARKFGTADTPWDEKAPLDENGWPTGDAGSVIVANAPLDAGDYAFSCSGRCEVAVLSDKARVKTQSYDHEKKSTTATITVDPEADKLFLAFKKTNGGVKNIRLLRPGYPLTTDQVFNKPFLDAIKPFSTLRLMDLTRTNDTEVKEWDQRAKLTDALQSSKKGVAWEYGIMLANQTGKDLWINVPVQASDDYVRQLARLIKKTLNKDRVVYVEYSNEVWNTIFPQFHYNYKVAKEEVVAGSPLNDGGKDHNTYFWAWKRVGKRLVEISNIFKEVYAEDGGPGAAAINTTIRPVLASQSAIPTMLRLQLDFLARNYGPPSEYIYGVAGAPYIGPDADVAEKTGVTVDELIDGTYKEGMKWIKDATLQYQVLARYYRLHALCYEGGTGFSGEVNEAMKVAANRDPRMEKLIQDYLGAWYSNGGELFMYFDLAGAYGKFGCWGLTEDIRKPTPKTAGILDVLKTPLPKEVAGASIPGTVPAWPPTASNGGAGIKDAEGHEFLGQMSADHYFDYLVNVKEAGDYTFSMQTASGLDGAQVEVLFSGDSIGMMTSKNTGDWYKFAATDPVAVHLEKGQLVVRLKLRKSALNVMSFTLEKR